MNGTLFVIEGVDGSGKATQTDLLYQALQKQERPVRKVSFPNYDSPSSSLIKMYLNGEFGTDPQAVNAFATSVFFCGGSLCFLPQGLAKILRGRWHHYCRPLCNLQSGSSGR